MTIQTSVKAVLFDLDGTLLDSIEAILASFAHVLERHMPGKAYTRGELVMKIGEPVPVQMHSFADGDALIAAVMADEYRAHNRAQLPSVPLFLGVRETLAALRARGFKVGIVTSKSHSSTAISLEAHGLAPLLDLLMTADDTPKHKPDPMPLLVAAERLQVLPGEIVYVGDSVHDIRCAQGAGAIAVAALWGPFERADLEALAPRFLVERLEGVLEMALLLQKG